jgi:endonuclease/exonuclease/phosphatase family metal-dependent hydrolase
MDALDVATLNIRNLADRWPERLGLLLADMAALQPDLMGLQECVYPMQQDRVIAAAGEGRYGVFRGWANRPEQGNSMLVREPLEARDVERLDLGRGRAAHRAVVALPGGSSVVFAVTHLHHVPADEAARLEQATALAAWLDDAPRADARIVVGDFNAEPVEPAYARMVDAGYTSAHQAANGREPDVTWPSGLKAPMIDDDGDPGCLDYVWLSGAVRVESCRVVFDRPHPEDATLYPSDHFGLSARLVVGA